MEQIKIFLAGFACILALAAMIICSVCAFIEGNALTVISGVINAAIGIGLFVHVMKNYYGLKMFFRLIKHPELEDCVEDVKNETDENKPEGN